MRILIVAFLMGCLSACGGGSDNDAGLASATDVSGAIAAATHAQALAFSGELDALKAQQAADEAALKKVEAFGHAPESTAQADSVRTQAMLTEPVVTSAISYGPCADMGQHIGDSAPDALGALIEDFKQCPINGVQYEYGAEVETGDIAELSAIWFDGANCTGNMIEFENDGGYNRQALQSGVVFRSPIDDTTILMVAASQAGQTLTSSSIFNNRACTNASETHTGYFVTPNDVNVTGVPTAVPSNFIF